MISNAVFIMPLIVIISTFYVSRYEWEAKTQMQNMGFILNLTENKHKSDHPKGENQHLYKHAQGKSREQAGQCSRQTSGKHCETYQPQIENTGNLNGGKGN